MGFKVHTWREGSIVKMQILDQPDETRGLGRDLVKTPLIVKSVSSPQINDPGMVYLRGTTRGSDLAIAQHQLYGEKDAVAFLNKLRTALYEAGKVMCPGGAKVPPPATLPAPTNAKPTVPFSYTLDREGNRVRLTIHSQPKLPVGTEICTANDILVRVEMSPEIAANEEDLIETIYLQGDGGPDYTTATITLHDERQAIEEMEYARTSLEEARRWMVQNGYLPPAIPQDDLSEQLHREALAALGEASSSDPGEWIIFV